MEFAVLLKAVPALETLRVDPERRTVVREGTELFANPFDARAVVVALAERRPEDRVTVVSMGPPGASAPLRDALALGVDRAILVSDPQLAGSDTLVTARVLARVLSSRVGPALVLSGTRTTDSETGQVGPEVAELLDFAFVAGARGLARREDGGGWNVTTDTEEGRALYRVSAPALVAVGEKIAKPGKPTPEARSTAAERPLELLGLGDLGLGAAAVGLSGSPTLVVAVREAASERAVRTIFAEGSTEERVASAVRSVARRLAECAAGKPKASGPEPERPGPFPPSEAAEEAAVVVTDREGRAESDGLALLAQFAEVGTGLVPSAIWAGSPPRASVRATLERSGARRGYVLRVKQGSSPSPRTVAAGLEALLRRRPEVSALALLSDPFGREVAGRLAARLGLGLTGDAIDCAVSPHDGTLVWQKPAFGGGMVADIVSRTRPSLATVRHGAFGLPEPQRKSFPRASAPGVFPWAVLDLPRLPESVSREKVDPPEDSGWGDLDRARVVVVVGMGLGGPERLPEIRPALRAWGAALAATRRVVDAGWLPVGRQVGLTGRSLAADLVVLLGVSGSPNHLVGWRRAGVLLAVDVRPEAPVFRSVDVGIVGRWEDVLPPLLPALAAALGRIPPS